MKVRFLKFLSNTVWAVIRDIQLPDKLSFIAVLIYTGAMLDHNN